MSSGAGPHKAGDGLTGASEPVFEVPAGMAEGVRQWSKLMEMNRRQRDIIDRFQTGYNEMSELADNLIYRLSLMGVRTQEIRERYEEVGRRVRGEAVHGEAGATEDKAESGPSLPADRGDAGSSGDGGGPGSEG